MSSTDSFDLTGSFDFSLSKRDAYEAMSVTAASLEEVAGRAHDAITTERITKNNTLLNTYVVVSDAISGGMGSVWRVHHQEWGMDLAMKRPHPRFFAEAGPARKAAFVAECEYWINLGLHPNIVSCYYVREVGGVPTVFSEWMDGGSLKDAIKSGALYIGTPDQQVERILDIAIQTARGLAYSHACGLLHQDVKPGNILLTADWDAKVSDFGLATAAVHVLEGAHDANAQPGVPAPTGYTLAYCPLEQVEGEAPAPWMDIYAWAVTMLEALLGRRPWERGSEVADLFEQVASGVDLPCPDGLLALLDDCLHRRDLACADVEATLVELYAEATGHRYLREQPKAAQDTAESLNNRAMSFLDLGRRDEALRLLDIAEEKNAQCLEVAFNHGALLWQDGVVDDLYLRDRILQFGPSGELVDLIRERRDAASTSQHAFRLRAELEDNEGCTKLAQDHAVHDFSLFDESTAILACGKGVNGRTWMEYAIALPGQDFRQAPLEYLVWNLDEDEYVATVNEGSKQWRVPTPAPEELVNRALAAGWTDRTPTCTAAYTSAEEALLLLGFGGSMCLVEGETGRCVRTYSFGCAQSAHRVAFSDDGKHVYACLAENGVPASWGLHMWRTVTPNWELPRLICRAQSVKQRWEEEDAFRRAMASFEEHMDAGRWRAAAEALGQAEHTSGFEADPAVVRGYERLAVEAIPTGVADLDLVYNLRRVIADRRKGVQMTPDGRFACFTNGKVWNLVDNHLVCEVEPFASDGHAIPIGFTADGTYAAYVGEQEYQPLTRSGMTVVDLTTGTVVDARELGLSRDDFLDARGERYKDESNVMAPNGVIALVTADYYELDACGIDFIDTRTGERIAREKTYWDPSWDLMPQDIAISRDARHILYLFQGNANTIAVYCEVQWEYPEQVEPISRPQEQHEEARRDGAPSAGRLQLIKRLSKLEQTLAERREELAGLSVFRFGRKRQLAQEIAELEAERSAAIEEFNQLNRIEQ